VGDFRAIYAALMIRAGDSAKALDPADLRAAMDEFTASMMLIWWLEAVAPEEPQVAPWLALIVVAAFALA
jgi:hypothetical protein